MIVDIPMPTEFSKVGYSIMFLAWSKTLDLLLAFRDPTEPRRRTKKSQKEFKYFLRCANIELQVNATLVLQAVEFLIKARIAQESPFLLLESIITDKASVPGKKVRFCELKTIGAAQLIKAHNAIGQIPIEG